ncbi:MAG: HAD-IA family hydrolase [Bacteroidaceae bacterium]
MDTTPIQKYLAANNFEDFQLKAVLFDMDGVLFDSMPHHAESWHNVMEQHGMNLSKEEAYLHEGRTGASTINLVAEEQLGHTLRQDEIQLIYKEKTLEFNHLPEPKRMSGAWDVIKQIKEDKLKVMVVTGSGQTSLLDRLNNSFPDTFTKENSVTAFDVKKGKPNPEPYLIALEKGGLLANEAVVIENAPLGIEAAHAAGLFTIAVNTGPLSNAILMDAGADLLFDSMKELSNHWKEVVEALAVQKATDTTIKEEEK